MVRKSPYSAYRARAIEWGCLEEDKDLKRTRMKMRLHGLAGGRRGGESTKARDPRPRRNTCTRSVGEGERPVLRAQTDGDAVR